MLMPGRDIIPAVIFKFRLVASLARLSWLHQVAIIRRPTGWLAGWLADWPFSRVCALGSARLINEPNVPFASPLFASLYSQRQADHL